VPRPPKILPNHTLHYVLASDIETAPKYRLRHKTNNLLECLLYEQNASIFLL